jgi:hypothetical protein
MVTLSVSVNDAVCPSAGISDEVHRLLLALKKLTQTPAIGAAELQRILGALELCVQCCEVAVGQSAFVTVPASRQGSDGSSLGQALDDE